MTTVPYIITNDSTITMVLNQKAYTIESNHMNYSDIVSELKQPAHDVDKLISLVDVVQHVNSYFDEPAASGIEVLLDAGIIKYYGNVIHSTLVDRILNMYKLGFNPSPMINFLKNLYLNPSNRAINELYSFIDYGKLPITEDGCFLAYKRVNDDYTSIHDKKTKNDIGTVVSMPRNLVDENSENTCSSGLHLCSYEYLQHFSGDRTVIIKVNPKDIVSIPTDYKNTKARACEYEVVGEVTEQLSSANGSIFTDPVNTEFDLSKNTYDDDSDDDSDDDYYDDEYSHDYGYEDEYPHNYSSQITEETRAMLDSNTICSPSLSQVAYNIGYNLGRKTKDSSKVACILKDTTGLTLSDNYTYAVSQQLATELNAKLKVGFTDGKNHRARKYDNKTCEFSQVQKLR